MSLFTRASVAFVASATLAGCATGPKMPPFSPAADGCGTMDNRTGQLVSMSVECLAQKQLAAEAAQARALKSAQIGAAAQVAGEIIRRPLGPNPETQNMGTVLSVLQVHEMGKKAGLTSGELQDVLPKGWTRAQVDQAADLVRRTFNGQCMRDEEKKAIICVDAPARAPAP